MERNDLDDNKNNVYKETSLSLNELVSSYPEYKELLNAFSEGKTNVELRKRYMLKQIDEKWVKAIEDTLPFIDKIIRNPENALTEREEVMPTELTKKVTGRSVVYLSQHTDMINEITPEGRVIPSKLLNVFQEDTFLTYENKFINTLLVWIYTFVSVRCEMAEKNGEDEKNTKLSVEQTFEKGKVKGKITLSIEASEPPEEDAEVKSYFYSSKLWKRVLNLKKITNDYMSSPFVAKLGRNYVRPPIIRTNKLLKNTDFKNCLKLWEFLDSYENIGYETLISEKLENVPDRCIKDLTFSLGEQYLLFDKDIRGVKAGETFAERDLKMITPHMKDTLDEFDESEFDYDEKAPKYGVKLETDEEKKSVVYAVEVALSADKALREQSTEEFDEKSRYVYRYSFQSKLILTQQPNQRYYGEIKNELLSYEGVRARMSFKHETFYFSKKLCAFMKFRGKTLYLYLPVVADDFDKRYRLSDVIVNKRRLAEMKIKSDRNVKYALELITLLLKEEGAKKAENFLSVDYDRPFEPLSQLLEKGLVKSAND